MTLRRRGDVHDIRPGFLQQLADIAKVGLDRKALEELTGHQRFTVADANHFTATDMLELFRVGVGDLAAPNDGDFKHNSLEKIKMEKQKVEI
jgi:hypothetical protein